MLLPFPDSQGQGISFFSSQPPSPLLSRRKITEEVVPTSEPNSVLDTMISPTSSSTVSSSHGGGNSFVGNTTTDPQCEQIGLSNWEQEQVHHDNEQSILRLIMGDDSTDPSHELNTILQSSPGFGVLDNNGLGFDHHHHSLPPPSHLLINQSQTHYIQNPSAIFYNPPPAKRLNPGPIGIKETLLKAAEVIASGENTCLAQTILARLNQQLSSPIGKPLERSAFYFKEALNNLLHHNNISQTLKNPYSLIFKIAAYKSFSEISPVLQFANFTSNQALLESFNGFNRLHIVDFDIGYGGQWASLMQELVLRDNGAPLSLKITIFSSPANHDHLEIDFTQENLKHFASEINISLEIQVLSLDLLSSISWPNESEQEAIAVNLSAAASFSHLPLILRFVKQLSPTIIVFSDRGCERTDLPFPQQIAHSLHSHTALLESLDAVNPNLDAMQKIERFIIQPEIEKLVMNRSRSINQPMMTWQAMFLQMGFSPMMYSNVTESQAECLVQRTPVKGFHVEKKHNSLVLCWHMTELIGVSAWR